MGFHRPSLLRPSLDYINLFNNCRKNMASILPSKLCVAAFDFGTTYSGYAFSFRDKPMDFYTPQTWYAGTNQIASLKTPTCLLLKKDGAFDSFGYEAQDRYSTYAATEEHTDYLYFHNFKMALHQTKVGLMFLPASLTDFQKSS